MAAKNWTDSNDDWTTDADWTPTGRPGSTDDALIAQGEPTITTDVGTVQSVTVGTNADLDIRGQVVSNLYIPGALNTGLLQNNGAIINFGNISASTFINDASFSSFNSLIAGSVTNSRSFTLTGSASIRDFNNLGDLQFSYGGSQTISGTLTNNGTATIDPRSGSDESVTVGGLANNGTLDLRGGEFGNAATLKVNGATTGSGSVTVFANSYDGAQLLEFGGATSNDIAITNDTNGHLQIRFDTPSAGYTGRITGFGEKDILDLKESIAGFTYDGTTLTVSPADGGAQQTYALAGPMNLLASPDGEGGTQFTVTCFATGTSIQTERGDVSVETLRVGDLALTASGALRPIRWVGHRMIDCAAASSSSAWPILIRAGAFGTGLPARDLMLSPGHPVLVGSDERGEGGTLVPIMCLINGTSIDRVRVRAITYWHVELDTHDILLAEGLPAESYLDWGDRPFFENASDHALSNPDFVVAGLAGRCRPVAVDGPVVERERDRLDAVFATRLTEACRWPGADSVFLPS